MQQTSVLNFPISIGTYQDFCQKVKILAKQSCSEYICVANVHMLIETYKDCNFATVVNTAAIVTPDGLPLTWALKWLRGIKQERVAGMDLLPDLLTLASQEKISIFFYGGTEDVLKKTQEHVKKHYTGIPSIHTYSPPFRKLTKEEDEAIAQHINNSGAKLIFVSLGCPKQEKWMASMKGKINGVMLGIGAALPVMVGEVSRAPKYMQKNGLEWLYRLYQEPRRLFKRYFITNSLFIYLVIREKFKTTSF